MVLQQLAKTSQCCTIYSASPGARDLPCILPLHKPPSSLHRLLFFFWLRVSWILIPRSILVLLNMMASASRLFISALSPTFYLCVAVLLSLIAFVFLSWAKHRHVPGPLFASVSNIPRLLWAWSGQAHRKHLELHRRHGKLVRLGPNCISVGDAREIQKIYGVGAKMGKVSRLSPPRSARSLDADALLHNSRTFTRSCSQCLGGRQFRACSIRKTTCFIGQ